MVMFAGDPGDIDEDTAKELDHTYFQNNMDKELNDLNRQLKQKEVLSIPNSYCNLYENFLVSFLVL